MDWQIAQVPHFKNTENSRAIGMILVPTSFMLSVDKNSDLSNALVQAYSLI